MPADTESRGQRPMTTLHQSPVIAPPAAPGDWLDGFQHPDGTTVSWDEYYAIIAACPPVPVLVSRVTAADVDAAWKAHTDDSLAILEAAQVT